MSYEHALRGCTPTPLASYLKSLAVLRLVAEQAGDADATGFWRGDAFVLRTRLAEGELLRFFLEAYKPTPLVAPWNGGSGFYFQEGKLKEKDPVTGKRLKTGVRNQPTEATRIVSEIEASTAKRLAAYRSAIASARAAIKVFGLTKAPENEAVRKKDLFITYFRNIAADSQLRWMDASLILADGEPEFPPLLGTGGNDGNFDFTTNFMQNLGLVLALDDDCAKPGADLLLVATLLGRPIAALPERTVGQFAPGSAGGPNATSGFEGEPRINPWDFILMLEGSVLLAASAVRRLESSTASHAAPFTVRGRLGTVGAASAADDNNKQNRGEIWMPLWTAPFTLAETVALFGEGRVALGTRPARDGLDFARAVARLGVDRGVASFQRYGFLMRSGKAYLATPLARVVVRRNAQADLIDELERNNWLGNVQRYGRDANAPSVFHAAGAQLDAALFELTQHADRVTLQKVLRQLGAIELLCARNPKAREAIPLPAPALSLRWAADADDGSAEFRIAAAFASLTVRGQIDGKPIALTLRPHLAPVSRDGASWDENSRRVCWGPGRLARNLFAVLHRRRLCALDLDNEGDMLASRGGATLNDVMQFLEGATDDRRIAELLAGLACVDLGALEAPRHERTVGPPPAYALLKPLFTAESLLRYLGWLPVDRALCLPAEIPARLASGDVYTSVQLAWQRLRAIGVKLPGNAPPRSVGLDGPRLLAALMIPLTTVETRRLLDAFDLTPGAPTETVFDLSATV